MRWSRIRTWQILLADTSTRVFTPRLLSEMALYDVESNICQALLCLQRFSNPRLFSETALYDVASNICQALPPRKASRPRSAPVSRTRCHRPPQCSGAS